MESITISKEQFNKIESIMYRVFNYMLLVEDMDMPEVNEALKKYEININSLELMETFKNVLNMDIE